MHHLSFLLGAALSAAVVLSLQAPPPGVPPQEPAKAANAANEAKPAPKPEAASADQPGRPARHPLEGVYELRSRVVDGVAQLESRGYLAITPRHMFLCVAAGGTDPDLPLLRAAVHEWKPDRELVRRVVRLSYYTDGGGGIHVDAPGAIELRMVRLVQGGVRVMLDEGNWLDFTRLE